MAAKKTKKLSGAAKASQMRKKVQRTLQTQDVQDRYEGAFTYWPNRSWIPGTVQDARFDADSSTRLELVRKSRYFERNSAVLNRCADIFEQYVAGATGLQMIPSSGDEDFNHAASEWWAGWCKFPDLISQQPFGTLQSLMARAWFIDGECFIFKTYSEDTNRPRLQLVEGHRVATPTGMTTYKKNSVIDGVEVNKAGRPVAYWVRKSNLAVTPYLDSYSATGQPAVEDFDRVPAEQMIHLFEPTRPGQLRGLPFVYPVLNTLHDLDDLEIYQMAKSKSASEVTNVVTTLTGEANTAAARRVKYQIQTQNALGTPVQKQQSTYFETNVGAGTERYLKPGEKMEQFKQEEPSVATQWYWEWLVKKCCAGLGISSLLVLPFSLQGTVTRADLDISAQFFRSRSAVLAAVCREIYVWVMQWATQYDRALDGAPDDWSAVTVRPPRSVNVDTGRNSQAMLAELEAGTRTYQDIFAEKGEDYRQQLRQKAKEARLINDLAKEFDLPREQIVALAKSMATESDESTPAPTPTPPAPAKAKLQKVFA
jgi:lambda family phage portal protein